MSENDPFGDNAPRAASLATTYQRQSGEMMVYGGTFFGLFLLLGGFMSGTPALFVLAAVLLGSAFYFFPMVRMDQAQLRVEPRGLYLEGLGWLPWSGIRNVRMFDRAVRTIRNTQLEVMLTGAAKDIVMVDGKPDLVRALMTRIWSVKRASDGGSTDMVLVRLEPLHASPEEILSAMKRYLPDG